MRNKPTKLLALCIITITLLSITTICNGVTNKVTNNQSTESYTYSYYGIINGNGHQATIYLKVNNNWEQYTISSNYKGYTCKLIVINRELTTKNYKQIKIINIKDIPTKDTNKANECINDWNNRNEVNQQ